MVVCTDDPVLLRTKIELQRVSDVCRALSQLGNTAAK